MYLQMTKAALVLIYAGDFFFFFFALVASLHRVKRYVGHNEAGKVTFFHAIFNDAARTQTRPPPLGT